MHPVVDRIFLRAKRAHSKKPFVNFSSQGHFGQSRLTLSIFHKDSLLYSSRLFIDYHSKTTLSIFRLFGPSALDVVNFLYWYRANCAQVFRNILYRESSWDSCTEPLSIGPSGLRPSGIYKDHTVIRCIRSIDRIFLRAKRAHYIKLFLYVCRETISPESPLDPWNLTLCRLTDNR